MLTLSIPLMKIQVLLLLTASASLAFGEKTVTPTLDSAGMFKNGLTVVRASFPIDGPSNYCWEKVPNVVHGSLWVESDGKVIIQSTTRMISETDESENPEEGSRKTSLARTFPSPTDPGKLAPRPPAPFGTYRPWTPRKHGTPTTARSILPTVPTYGNATGFPKITESPPSPPPETSLSSPKRTAPAITSTNPTSPPSPSTAPSSLPPDLSRNPCSSSRSAKFRKPAAPSPSPISPKVSPGRLPTASTSLTRKTSASATAR